MNCGYDTIALILFVITVFACGMYITKLRKQFVENNQIHDRFSKYFKKNN